MRINRSIQILAVLAAAAACSSNGDAAAVPASTTPAATADPVPAPVAAAPAPVAAAPVTEPAAGVSLNVHWDPAPLDRDYRRERAALDARHAREMKEARADERADARARRQAEETKALQDRYDRGKRDHARGLPPQ